MLVPYTKENSRDRRKNENGRFCRGFRAQSKIDRFVEVEGCELENKLVRAVFRNRALPSVDATCRMCKCIYRKADRQAMTSAPEVLQLRGCERLTAWCPCGRLRRQELRLERFPGKHQQRQTPRLCLQQSFAFWVSWEVCPPLAPRFPSHTLHRCRTEFRP